MIHSASHPLWISLRFILPQKERPLFSIGDADIGTGGFDFLYGYCDHCIVSMFVSFNIGFMDIYGKTMVLSKLSECSIDYIRAIRESFKHAYDIQRALYFVLSRFKSRCKFSQDCYKENK